MKKTMLTFLTMLFFASCSKDNPALEDPLVQLPPKKQMITHYFDSS